MLLTNKPIFNKSETFFKKKNYPLVVQIIEIIFFKVIFLTVQVIFPQIWDHSFIRVFFYFFLLFSTLSFKLVKHRCKLCHKLRNSKNGWQSDLHGKINHNLSIELSALCWQTSYKETVIQFVKKLYKVFFKLVSVSSFQRFFWVFIFVPMRFSIWETTTI